MKFTLKGEYGPKQNSVWLNGARLDITPSLKFRKHSFDFAWGYMGSGPMQLAYAILLQLRGQAYAEANCFYLKQDVIAMLPNESFAERTIEWEPSPDSA